MHSITTISILCVAMANTRAEIVVSPSPTPPPTPKPIGTQVAVYDPDFGAPRCHNVGNICNALGLHAGVDNSESNGSNTIDGCEDYSIGTHYVDESIEQLVLRSVTGEAFSIGEEVEIIAIVYTAADTSDREYPNQQDMGHFFYTSDAYNVTWKYLDYFILDPGSGVVEIRTRFTLEPGSSTQALRLTYGYGEYKRDPCSRWYSWQDIDDLVFEIYNGETSNPSCQPSDSPSSQPTSSPSTQPSGASSLAPTGTSSTANPSSSNPTLAPTESNEPTLSPTDPITTASYDVNIKAPRCSNVGSSCSSDGLLNGSGLFSGNHLEQNTPNLIDDCEGDNATLSTIQSVYQQDESVDKIVIRSVGCDIFRVGHEVEVEIYVWSAQDVSQRTNPNKWSVAHIYYTPKVETNNVTWKYIWSEIVHPSQGEKIFSTRFELDADASYDSNSAISTVTQAVRVSYAYAQYKPNNCPESDGYFDVDDLVFEVSLLPPTPAPTVSPKPPSNDASPQGSSYRRLINLLYLVLLFAR